jgi:carbamoyl-phosphate synthase large subunit
MTRAILPARMKVLVTGAGALLGQGIIRSLLECKLDVEVIAADPSELSAGLYWVARRYKIPLAKDPSYLERIDALLARERPDAVLVGTDVELPILAQHRDALEGAHGTHVVVSSPRVVAIADDKYETYRFFRELGMDCPDSALPGDEEALIARVGFPLVVKPRIGARSVGVYHVRDRDELARALATDERVVIQECVATDRDEYTAGTLCFDGRCAASIVMRRDLRDGNTYRAYVDRYPELNTIVHAMAEKLGSFGPANFQFRLDRGRVKVFEINARFSGTTPLRMRAGFNEVELVLRRVVLGEPVEQPPIVPMTILRYWSETVVLPGEHVAVA